MHYAQVMSNTHRHTHVTDHSTPALSRGKKNSNYRAYHYAKMVNELVDDNTVAAPWNDDWRQELHSFLSW